MGLYKLVDNLGGYLNVTFGNKWKRVALLLRLTQKDEEAVKDCYKEYIGMVKVYYKEAERSLQGKGPKDEVVGNSSGTAHVKDPLGHEGINVEVESTLEETPKKTTQFGVSLEGNKEEFKEFGLWKTLWKRHRKNNNNETVGTPNRKQEELDLNNYGGIVGR